MRTKLIETNKPEKYANVVRNAETVSIPRGTPLVLNLSGTPQPSTYQNSLPAGAEDGLQVVLPSSGGAFAANFYDYGVAYNDIPAGQLGDALIDGVVQALVIMNTRSASDANWATSASQAASVLLVINTVANAFSQIASSGTAASNTTISSYASDIIAVLIDSYATQVTASSTNTADTRTLSTALRRCFLRRM